MKSMIRWLVLIGFCRLAPLAAPAATLHVWQDSPSPGPPFSTWLTAARHIQEAVDAADPGDTIIVSGGIYDTGGRAAGTELLPNRVAID
jgi:hypothetical protein